MKLLNFNMYNLCRLQFANLESKHKWERKIRNGSQLYPKLEYLTVADGVRQCMIDHDTYIDNIDQKAQFYSKLGLVIIPMTEVYISEGFSHTHAKNGRKAFRSVVARTLTEAEEFIHYHQNNDHIGVGRMLGFPESSCRFFADIWDKGYFDPIWQQAEKTSEPMVKNKRDFTDKEGKVTKRLIRLRQMDELYLISSVFRYINIRILSHMPRSFDDYESLEVARKWIQVAKDHKLDDELQDVIDIMRLPYEWDCLKGVAVINTPVFKLVVNSMACYPNHVVQQESDYYPDEAPMGIKFPWKVR